METVCLFADISGFTKCSEAYATLGIRGNEELAACINKYMEIMVQNFYNDDASIVKFIGDALIVMWPKTKTEHDHNHENDKCEEEEEDKVITIRRAIQCS